MLYTYKMCELIPKHAHILGLSVIAALRQMKGIRHYIEKKRGARNLTRLSHVPPPHPDGTVVDQL
jgi:hypothetical protein